MNTLTQPENNEIQEEEWTYQEIFSQVLSSGRMTMTILKSELLTVKKGVVNAKQANRKRALYNGLPWDTVVLRFKEEECKNAEERDFYIDLTVFVERKAIVKVKRVSTLKTTLELEED